MAKRVRKADLYKGNGEAVYMQREQGEMFLLMEQDSDIAYVVVTEGVLHDNGYYRAIQTVQMHTREEFEEMKELGVIKFEKKINS